jgi:competence protein ComEC
MKILNFPIIILTLCLILGILFEHFFAIDLTTTIVCLILSFLASTLLFLKSKNTISNSALFGISIYVCVFTIGVFNAKMYTNKQLNNHYKNQMVLNESTPKMIVFKIREVLKPSRYYDKYLIRVLQVDSCIVSGKVLLNVEKNTSNKLLTVDDIINVKTTFKNIQGPLNPNQFDYKSYLNKHHVFHQLHTKTSQLFLISNEKHTVLGYAAKIREYIQNKLKTASFSHDEFAIIEALFLGQRQNVSKDLFQTYSKAGVIHILAVSGLHVGIILLLLNTLLQPLIYVKNGRSIKTLLVVIILWCFAIVAGLSASVVRAITMFSIIALGMHLKRLKIIYNTLAISMFLLLSINPNFLFDIGFQLSYIAVISIVLFQPILFKLYYPKYLIDRFLWNIFTVSVAAQIGVLPLSVFYFHQFPGLFFISNLVIIPFLGIILAMGIIVISFASINALPDVLLNVYSFIIRTLNVFVKWISNHEEFIWNNISFDLIEVLLSYLIISMGLCIIYNKSFRNILLGLIVVIIMQLYLVNNIHLRQTHELIIFHKTKHTLIGIRNNSSLIVHHNLHDSMLKQENTLINYSRKTGLNKIRYDGIKNVYKINEELLLVIDSFGIYQGTSFKPTYILMRNSPKINLKRLIDSFHPKLIISDGSNYKTYQTRWEATCKEHNISFHKTPEKGHIVLTF